MANAGADWQSIKTAYITGDGSVTHESLAEANGISRVTISRRAAREGWITERLQHRHRVVTKTLEKAGSLQAEVRARQLGIAKAMYSKAFEALKAMDPAKMDMTEIRLYLASAADIERKAAGIQDEVRIDHNLALSDEERAARLAVVFERVREGETD